jgi:hypothetical protein
MEPQVLVFFVPIVAIVMGIGIGMLGLWLDYRKKREIFELHHKERMAAIEKGMEVPPLPAELFQDHRRRLRAPGDYLRRGLTMVLIGLAIFVALYMTPGAGARVAYWGLVPSAIGLGNLFFYFIEGRKQPPGKDNDGR